jgi:hypothetical protein
MLEKLVLLLFLFLPLPAFGQATQIIPDCTLNFSFTAAARSLSFDNRRAQCTTWHLVYYSTGFSAVSIEFDFADDSSGSPGSWSVWPDLAPGTSLPLTSTTSAQATGFKHKAWASVNLNSVTGSGVVSGTLFGYRATSQQDSSSVGGGGTSVNLASVGGTGLSGANVVDAGNTAFRVNCVVGCGASSFTDNGVFTGGTTSVNPIAALYDTTPPAVTDGSAGIPRMSSARVLFVDLSLTTANATAVKVDGSAVTQPVSGTFFQATQPVSITAGNFPDNEPFNVAQWAGGTLGAMANYGTSPGAVLVPGVNAFITNTPTVTANAGTNLNTSALLLDATFTGRINTQGQKTMAASTPVVIASDQASIPVAATLAAETTKVIGTVRNLGNLGGIFDTTQNAAVAANSLLQGCNFTTAPATLTTANQGAVQCNSKGELLTQLTDGTTNVAVIAATTALKTDLSSVAGTATVTGTGASGAGIARVTVSNDSSILGTKTNNNAAPGATNFGTLPSIANAANPLWTEGNQVALSVDLAGYQRANVGKWGGTALGTPTNFGTTPGAVIAGSVNSSLFIGTTVATAAAAGIQKVGISGNAGASVDAATGAAPPANALLVSGLTSGATGGFMKAITVADSYVNVNIVTATTVLLVTGVSGRHVRISSISLVAAGADNVALLSGTGATCGTGTTGMTGGTTAGTGYNLAAGGNIQLGSGLGQVNQTNATGDSVCIVTSAAVQLSGRIAYSIW